MSFILEALKKSEKNRQQNSVPTLDTQHRSTEPQPRKRALWPLLLLAVLLINAGVLLWLFGPWHNAPAPAAQPAGHKAVEVPAPAVARTAAPTPPQTNEPAAVSPSSSAASRPQPVTVPAAATATTQPPRPSSAPELIDEEAAMAPPRLEDPDRIAFEPQPAPVQVTPAAQPAAAAVTLPQPTVSPQPAAAMREIAPPDTSEPVATAARIYAINELPSHLRQQLPRLHMSVHAYSEGGGGLIRLNDKIMRVGSYLDGRYRLEEITPDGAVFSVQGTHFSVPRKGL